MTGYSEAEPLYDQMGISPFSTDERSGGQERAARPKEAAPMAKSPKTVLKLPDPSPKSS